MAIHFKGHFKVLNNILAFTRARPIVEPVLKYATFSPTKKTQHAVLSQANLALSGDSMLGPDKAIAQADIGVTVPTQKRYFEISAANGILFVGIANNIPASFWTTKTIDSSNFGSYGIIYVPLQGSSGVVYINGNSVPGGYPYARMSANSQTDVVGVAISDGFVWFSLNGVYNRGNPTVAGSGFPYTGMGFPTVQLEPQYAGTPKVANFGATAFKYLPSGYSGFLG